MVDDVPLEAHDWALDLVVSATTIYRPGEPGEPGETADQTTTKEQM